MSDEALSKYFSLLKLNASAHAIKAGAKLGVFDALRDGQRTSAELAEQCGLIETPLRLLLESLRTLEVVEQYDEHFALSQVMHLVGERTRDLGDSHWRRLAEFVRTGETASDGDSDMHAYRGALVADQWTMTPAALVLAEMLEIGGQRTSLDILDVGAGAAVWSLTMAYRDAASRVTAVDLPAALEFAVRTATDIDVQGRLTAVHADYRAVEFAEHGPFDLALAAQVLQLEPLESARPWLRRVRSALRPSGELVLIGSYRLPQQTAGLDQLAMEALELALRTPAGQLHAAEEVSELLKSEGFVDLQFAAIPAPPQTIGVFVARRAG